MAHSFTQNRRLSSAPHYRLRLILPILSILLLGACGRLDLTYGPLLSDVSVSPDQISPNADGDIDVTEIRYSLNRSAQIRIYFDSESGERFFFRRGNRRSPGEYRVLWGGVVDDPVKVEEGDSTVEVLSRVLPDGRYVWTIEAETDEGSRQEASGEITLEGGDTTIPELNNFAVVPQVFRPNQDGLRDDWVSISYYLSEDVDTIQIYLVNPDEPDLKYHIAESANLMEPEERGYHEYRYEGGVDLNAEPPPDGRYLLYGEARDRAGNHIRVSNPLVIEEGGKPRADVAQGEIDWSGEMNRIVSVPLGQSLCFRAIVTNEGTVPIRTTGPWPGQTYQFGQNYNTLAAEGNEEWFQQAGVWRFGINFDTTGIDFPYRWAIGRQEDLERRIIDGQEQWYLLPGQSGEVSGCIQITEEPPVGTNFWWGGLIHEFVGVTNNFIDRISVDVGVP